MTDMQELFDRDPLALTREDRTKIIEYYRENRTRFITTGKATKPTPTKPVLDIKLEDLDL